MSSTADLEIKGDFHRHRLAELLTEISLTRLNGSLRAANGSQKIVVYFDAGDVVFAVSNARAFRLFEVLLRENKITREELASIPEFTNDLVLKEHLLKKNLFLKTETDALFARQIEEILRDAFGWRGGAWIFSPLVRIKGDIRFKVDAASLLLEYARKLPAEELTSDFKNLQETFLVNPALPASVDLQPEEAFVFSRFENSSPKTVAEIGFTSGLPAAVTERILYILWLGGFLKRQDWNSPFSNRQVSHILSANLSLKKDEAPTLPKISQTKIESPATAAVPEIIAAAEETPPEKEITLEEYLGRMENSTNYYHFFDVAPSAAAADIKNSYFMLARRFHPDLFHKEVDAQKHRQIQNAFTKIAKAYETLKNESTRAIYDYKARKELAKMDKSPAGSPIESDDKQKELELAKSAFEHGFTLLLDENHIDAIPFLARAAHFAPGNARYRAFYGKALAAEGKQKHKAEAELQAAVKLDAGSADIRLMLAEFFIRMRLPKRAEGELNRLLAIFPGNAEARALLDTLPKR